MLLVLGSMTTAEVKGQIQIICNEHTSLHQKIVYTWKLAKYSSATGSNSSRGSGKSKSWQHQEQKSVTTSISESHEILKILLFQCIWHKKYSNHVDFTCKKSRSNKNNQELLQGCWLIIHILVINIYSIFMWRIVFKETSFNSSAHCYHFAVICQGYHY